MAKSPEKPKENISAFFRDEFRAHPEWLDEKSNDKALNRWSEAHPDDPEPNVSVKQTLANLKSQLRKQRREGLFPEDGAAAGRPVHASHPHPAPSASAGPHHVPSHRLDTLEEAIDDCLTAAKNLDREGLADVVRLLRKARNEVVWKMGE